MKFSLDAATLLALESDPGGSREFYELAEQLCADCRIFPDLGQLLSHRLEFPQRLILLDTETMNRMPTADIAMLRELRSREKIALITSSDIEEYLHGIRSWGVLQSIVKTPPLDEEEIAHSLYCLQSPGCAFGLHQYLSREIRMQSISVSTIEEKNSGIESVINHFATANFEIHDLYDVRLILEETLNNSFYHAFKTATGEEKYHLNTFQGLDKGERIRIEFGSNDRVAGFTVTDNAGSLPVATIINKLERQFNRDGLLDTSGRGLYLSRMLTSRFVINIDPGKRTQVIALFDDRRKTDRPKPFSINLIGDDGFAEWGAPEELD